MVSDVLEVLKQAIQLEEDGQKYYSEAAARVQNPLAQNTFSWLAKQEEAHRHYFILGYYRVIEEQRNWPPMSQIGVKEHDVRQLAATIFKLALGQIEDAVPADVELTELYQGAMEMERKSIDLYRTQAQQADDEQVREFYEFLVEQERGHLNLLATTLEYLDDPESWYFTEEQWIVEG